MLAERATWITPDSTDEYRIDRPSKDGAAAATFQFSSIN
jgi:hypothetical protein